MIPGIGDISGGQGGIAYNPSATSGSGGGNSTVTVGGFNVPTYPQAFGFPGAPAAGSSLPLIVAAVAVVGVVWYLTQKR